MFTRLSDAIVAGELAENEPLNDHQLAAAFGVSRTPVREALQRLQQLGLVDATPQVGTKVAPVDDDLIVQILEFSGIQSSMVVAMAVPRLSESDRIHAIDLVQALIDAPDPATSFQAGRDFVKFMTDRCGNVMLQRAIADMRFIVLRSIRHIRPILGADPERIACYRRMQDAIRDGDGERAAAAFREQHRLPLRIVERATPDEHDPHEKRPASPR